MASFERLRIFLSLSGLFIKPEVEYILSTGHHEKRKDQFNPQFESWDYSIRGRTLDNRNLRIIIALVSPNILVVTAINLDEENDEKESSKSIS